MGDAAIFRKFKRTAKKRLSNSGSAQRGKSPKTTAPPTPPSSVPDDPWAQIEWNGARAASSNSIYNCNVCSQSYYDKRDFENHLQTCRIEEERVYSCSFCKRGFQTLALKDAHEVLHATPTNTVISRTTFPPETVLTDTPNSRYTNNNVRHRDSNSPFRSLPSNVEVLETVPKKATSRKSTSRKSIGSSRSHSNNTNEYQPASGRGNKVAPAPSENVDVKPNIVPSRRRRRSLVDSIDLTSEGNQPKPVAIPEKQQPQPLQPVQVCRFCRNVFYDLVQLHLHERNHISDMGYRIPDNHAATAVVKRVFQYSCEHCPSTFDNLDELHSHRRQFHRNEMEPLTQVVVFSCDSCPQSFESRSTLMEHRAQEHPIQQAPPKQIILFSCELCPKNYKDRKDLIEHKAVHDTSKSSDDLGEESESSAESSEVPEIAERQQKKESESSYKCDTCRNSFASSVELQKHIAESHTGFDNKSESGNSTFSGFHENEIGNPDSDGKFPCSFCERIFTRATGLASHMRAHHQAEYRKLRMRSNGNATEQPAVLPSLPNLDEVKENESGSEAGSIRLEASDSPRVTRQSEKGKKIWSCNVCSKEWSTFYQFENHRLYSKCKSKVKSILEGKPEQQQQSTAPLTCKQCGGVSNNGDLCESCLTRSKASSLVSSPPPNDTLENEDDGSSRETVEPPDSKELDDVKDVKPNARIHVCDVCFYTCPGKGDFRKHLTIHSERATHECKYCYALFNKNVGLHRHQRKHELDGGLFRCLHCDRTFMQKGDLRRHCRYLRMRLLKAKLLEAEESQDGRPSIELTTRLAIGTTPTSNADQGGVARPDSKQCPVCYQTVSTASDREKHMKEHQGEPQFSCKYCRAGFVSKTAFSSHEALHTTSNGKLKCLHCERLFTYPSRLIDHFRTAVGRLQNSDEKEAGNKENISAAASDADNRKADSESEPGMSSEESSNKGTYSCTVCFQHFSLEKRLARHRDVHGGESSLQCDLCGAHFKKSTTLKRHEAMHLVPGGGSYKCLHCNKNFKLKLELMNHCAAVRNQIFLGQKTLTLPETNASAIIKEEHKDDNDVDEEMEDSVASEVDESFEIDTYQSPDTDPSQPDRCHICFKRVDSRKANFRSNLKQHIEQVHKNKSFECRYCYATFARSQYCQKHEELHMLDDGSLKCLMCNGTFESHLLLIRHNTDVHNRNKVLALNGTFLPSKRAPVVQQKQSLIQQFSKKAIESRQHGGSSPTLQQRYRSLSTQASAKLPRPFKCTQCSARFSSKYDIQRHVRLHSLQRSKTTLIKCKFCKATFKWRKRLTIHVRAVHPELLRDEEFDIHNPEHVLDSDTLKSPSPTNNQATDTYPCQLCPETFATASFLTLHQETSHYACEVCGHVYVSFPSLQEHQRASHPEISISSQFLDGQMKLKGLDVQLRNIKLPDGVQTFSVRKLFSADPKSDIAADDDVKPDLVIPEKVNGYQSPLPPPAIDYDEDLFNEDEELSPVQKSFQCKYCYYKFDKPIDCQRHSELHEMVDGSLKCLFCNKCFKSHLSLIRHNADMHMKTEDETAGIKKEEMADDNSSQQLTISRNIFGSKKRILSDSHLPDAVSKKLRLAFEQSNSHEFDEYVHTMLTSRGLSVSEDSPSNLHEKSASPETPMDFFLKSVHLSPSRKKATNIASERRRLENADASSVISDGDYLDLVDDNSVEFFVDTAEIEALMTDIVNTVSNVCDDTPAAKAVDEIIVIDDDVDDEEEEDEDEDLPVITDLLYDIINCVSADELSRKVKVSSSVSLKEAPFPQITYVGEISDDEKPASPAASFEDINEVSLPFVWDEGGDQDDEKNKQLSLYQAAQFAATVNQQASDETGAWLALKTAIETVKRDQMYRDSLSPDGGKQQQKKNVCTCEDDSAGFCSKHDENIFKCLFCNEDFYAHVSLMKHLAKVHNRLKLPRLRVKRRRSSVEDTPAATEADDVNVEISEPQPSNDDDDDDDIIRVTLDALLDRVSNAVAEQSGPNSLENQVNDDSGDPSKSPHSEHSVYEEAVENQHLDAEEINDKHDVVESVENPTSPVENESASSSPITNDSKTISLDVLQHQSAFRKLLNGLKIQLGALSTTALTE